MMKKMEVFLQNANKALSGEGEDFWISRVASNSHYLSHSDCQAVFSAYHYLISNFKKDNV